MVCYVDDMYRYPMGRYRGMKMSHMIADTEAELHEMAAKIGVARKWYQGNHYDICYSKRQLAISHGAVETTVRQLVRMNQRRRGRRRGSSNAVEGFTEPLEARNGPAGAGLPRDRLGGPSGSGNGE